jgi:hypothetical protein
MFLFCSKVPGLKTLNTPCLASETVSLTAQDIAVLDELTQLGLQLARLMCRAATKFLEAEPEPPAQGADPKTPPRPKPPAFATAFATAFAPAFAPACAQAFARIARVIQTGITLKNRLVAGQAPPEPAAPAMPETASDPRRPSIAAYLHKLVDALPHHPNARVLHRTIEARIDKLLAADPGYTLRGSDIVIPICTDLGLPYDLAKMHDDLIFPVGRTRKRRIPKLGLDDEPDIEANGHDPP